jgi:hypothetical protein
MEVELSVKTTSNGSVNIVHPKSLHQPRCGTRPGKSGV